MSKPVISEAEEAARRSRRGYEYQDLVAASFCLEMLRNTSLQRVACETQDDVVLTWAVDDVAVVNEFVQVKSDRQKQHWTVSLFCEQEKSPNSNDGTKGTNRNRKDTSIFEKNALRNQEEQNSYFRIVTRADVKDLRVLTETTGARKTKEMSDLVTKLESALGGNTTLTHDAIKYWVGHAVWDVRGTDEALFNENFRKLTEIVETLEQRLIPGVALERILHHLAEETRAMAMGKGRFGVDPSAILQKEMQKWLNREVQAVPHFLGATETDILLREERHSIARCESLWLALGVEISEATALARQANIGARPEFFAGLGPGFHWVTAAYGAGKSLAVERVYQTHLAKYLSKRDEGLPIFLRAYSVSGTLQDAVTTLLRELHLNSKVIPLFVILDAVDEAGSNRAHRLLLEAQELCSIWPNSTVIATSVNLPIHFECFKRPLPLLTDEQACEIVDHFAKMSVSPYVVRDRLDSDIGLSLMCVLLGQALRETSDLLPSRGELLHRVVDAARKRSGNDADGWAKQAEILCRIAMLSTDSGGGPVAPGQLGMSSIEIAQLATTKLIAEEAGQFVFTVATMRLWFAAQALSRGWLHEKTFFDDVSRVRHWQEPLAIFVATSDFDSAAGYIERLASVHPAIAAKVITDSTSKQHDGKALTASDLDIFAKRIHLCLSAWLKGIEPLSKKCSVTSESGALLKLSVGNTGKHTILAFSRDPSLPPTSRLPIGWNSNDFEMIQYYQEAPDPSRLWHDTFEMVRRDLIAFVKTNHWERFDKELFHEEVWNQAVGFAKVSGVLTSRLPWQTIEKFESVFRPLGQWEWLIEKRIEYPDALPAPHPPSDATIMLDNTAAISFSNEAALARTQSIYSMAFFAYQRIVNTYFPNFRSDLPYSAIWPCRLIGVVSGPHTASIPTPWWIGYHFDPVESEAESEVSLQLANDLGAEGYELLEALYQKTIKMRPKAPPTVRLNRSALKLCSTHPASTLVKEWLLSDLNNAGWR